MSRTPKWKQNQNAAQQRPDRRDWMTPDEAAEYLRVTTRTLRAWIAESKVPAYRIDGGRGIRIDRHDLDKLLVRMGWA